LKKHLKNNLDHCNHMQTSKYMQRMCEIYATYK
jgi:hypothetical protein